MSLSQSRIVAAVIKVFVVDAHEIARRGIAGLLLDEPGLDLVGEVATAAEAVSLVPTLEPDVVIVETHLPDGDGVALCESLRADSPELKCLLFTEASDHDAIYGAILGGVDGIVSKAAPGSDLVAALRRLAAGQVVLDPALTGQVMHRLRGLSAENERLALLSPRERSIVGLIAEGKSNREIAEALGIAEKTVKNNVSHLLLKLGFSRRIEIAVYMARLEIRRVPSVATLEDSRLTVGGDTTDR